MLLCWCSSDAPGEAAPHHACTAAGAQSSGTASNGPSLSGSDPWRGSPSGAAAERAWGRRGGQDDPWAPALSGGSGHGPGRVYGPRLWSVAWTGAVAGGVHAGAAVQRAAALAGSTASGRTGHARRALSGGRRHRRGLALAGLSSAASSACSGQRHHDPVSHAAQGCAGVDRVCQPPQAHAASQRRTPCWPPRLGGRPGVWSRCGASASPRPWVLLLICLVRVDSAQHDAVGEPGRPLRSPRGRRALFTFNVGIPAKNGCLPSC